jgi:protocatechuate 3,4-dioxygenase beta subunit
VAAPELAGNSRNTSTDADGRYEVTDLPAGQYTVNVSRSGYLALRYGQRRPLERGKPLQVRDKQVVDHIDFSLPRMGLITGRISDDIGDPIEGVMVLAMRSRYWEGRRQLVPTGQGFTHSDDAGQFRILGLAPGTYYVMASTRETWTVNQGGVPRVMGYAPTYFPGTTTVGEARRVTVALGREANSTDFSLIVGRAASISGTAFNSQGRPFAHVELREEVRGENFAQFGGNKNAVVAADGSFTIRDVSPGDYKVAATSERGGDRPEVAIVPVAVDSTDVTGVVLTGSEGGSIAGQLLTDTGAVPTIPRLRISIGLPLVGQPDPMLLGTFRDPGSSQVAADGSFSIKGVFGRSRLRVALTDDWMVKAILHGGRDITDEPIELKSGESLTGVQVIVTDRVSTLTGQLSDDQGAPLTDATILVFADDSGRWADDSRAVRAVRPDQDGQYKIKGLPAGAYLAIALDYVEDGMWNDPEYLESLRSHAQKLTVAEASAQTMALKLVDPAK